MKTGIKILVILICIITLTLVLGAVTLNFNHSVSRGPYTVVPGNGSPIAPYLAGTAKDAPIVSFWQLPQWLQIAAGIDVILIVYLLLHSVPLVIGRVQDVLRNRNRLSVFNYVSSNPGCTFTDISEGQEMNIGTVKYHVLMLESKRKIIVRRMGRYIRLFSTARANSDLEKAVLAYVKNDTSKSLLYAIMQEPGITNGKLSEKFNLDKSSVHWHIKRFMDDRLIRSEREGKNKRYFVEPDVIALLNDFSKHEPCV